MKRSEGRAQAVRRTASTTIVVTLLLAATATPDDRLPLLPIALQTSDAEKTNGPPAIPEASDAAMLPPLPTPQVPSQVVPEASQAPASDDLISRLAESARAANAKPAASQTNPTVANTIRPAPEGTPFLAEPQWISEACCYSAGVNFRRPTALDFDPRVRGYRVSQITMAAGDVQQIATRIDVDAPLDQIDPGLVGALTILNGPYSSLYGPGFAFLVADLKAPQRFETPQGSAATMFGYETNGARLAWRQTASAGGQTWGFTSSFGQGIGNDYTPGGDLFRIPASYNVWDGFAAFSLDVAPCRTLDVFYLHNEQNNVELPGVAYDVRQSSNSQFSVRYAMWEGETRCERVVLHAWANETRWHGDNFAPSKQATMFGALIGAPLGPFNNPLLGELTGLAVRGEESNYGTRGYVKLGDPEEVELIAGADWRLERFFHSEADFGPTGAPAFGGEVFGVPRASATSGGAFVHVTGKPTPSLTLTTGGRVDAWRAGFNVDDDVVSAGGAAPTFTGAKQPEYFLGMAYLTAKQQVGEFVALTGGAGYAMRPPGLAELYSDRPWTPLVRFGNSLALGDSELKPERLMQFDLGARGDWPGLSLGGRAFAAAIDDYILYRALTPINGNGPAQLGRKIGAIDVTDDAVVPYQYQNLSGATLVGGDLSAEWRVQPWCTAFGLLTYVKGVNHDPLVLQPDGGYRSKGSEGLPGMPPFWAVAGARVFEPEHERYGVELSSRLVARQNYVADSLGELETPGYTVWNLRGWVKVSERLTIATGVRNLFNRNFTEHGSLAIADPRTGAIFFTPEPGVTWTMSVEVKY